MQEHTKQAIWAVGLASVAGLLGHIMRTIRHGRKVRVRHAIYQTLASGFVGYLVCHVGRALNVGENWMAPLIGVSGWVGASSMMVVVERLVFKKLGVDTDPKPKE